MVEGACLENRCTATYRGFESLSHRKAVAKKRNELARLRFFDAALQSPPQAGRDSASGHRPRSGIPGERGMRLHPTKNLEFATFVPKNRQNPEQTFQKTTFVPKNCHNREQTHATDNHPTCGPGKVRGHVLPRLQERRPAGCGGVAMADRSFSG